MKNVYDIIAEINSYDPASKYFEIRELVKQLILQGVPIKTIEWSCPQITIYNIMDYLSSYNQDEFNNINAIIDNAIANYYNNVNVTQNKCLVIADNHMGRIGYNEYNNIQGVHNNERGLYAAYNHALRNNINTIIHLGDLIEGDSDPTQNKISNIQQQIEYFKRCYPKCNNIKTYLLYGNHDYNAICFDGINKSFYKAIPNLELIGVNQSYLNFCGTPVKLSHECSMAKDYKNANFVCDFELSGHSHFYYLYEDARLIKVPALASVTKCQESTGFLEMIDEENEFVFKFFDQYDCEDKQQEYVLTKTKKIGF